MKVEREGEGDIDSCGKGEVESGEVMWEEIELKIELKVMSSKEEERER